MGILYLSGPCNPAVLLLCIVALLSMGCGGLGAPAGTDSPARVAQGDGDETAGTAGIRAVATAVLGAGSEVVAVGNLARNGRTQAVVVNRIASQDAQANGKTLFTRGAIVQQDGTRWVEVLRCDEYLKNPVGFLDANQSAQANGWRFEMSPKKDSQAQILKFTALQSNRSPGAYAIAVSWNPRVSRYQAMAADGQFRGEVASLEIPRSELR